MTPFDRGILVCDISGDSLLPSLFIIEIEEVHSAIAFMYMVAKFIL